MVSKSKIHPVLVSGISLWILTSFIAALDWHGISLRRLIALGAIASAITLFGLALNSRRLTIVATRFVGRAIVRAPRQAKWEGYGEGAADALAGGRRDDTTQNLVGRGSRP